MRLLAQYTGRRDELAAFRLFTRGVMCEGLDEASCLPVLGEFGRILAEVAPGSLPANIPAEGPRRNCRAGRKSADEDGQPVTE